MSVGHFTFMAHLPAWGPFAFVWPFYTYIGPFTTTWTAPHPSVGRSAPALNS